MVIEGVVKRNKPIRVLRDSVVIFEGELESLRRFKENVEEVRNGTECGIAVKAYNDVKPGDQIECFERIEVPRTCNAARWPGQWSGPHCSARPLVGRQSNQVPDRWSGDNEPRAPRAQDFPSNRPCLRPAAP